MLSHENNYFQKVIVYHVLCVMHFQVAESIQAFLTSVTVAFNIFGQQITSNIWIIKKLAEQLSSPGYKLAANKTKQYNVMTYINSFTLQARVSLHLRLYKKA